MAVDRGRGLATSARDHHRVMTQRLRRTKCHPSKAKDRAAHGNKNRAKRGTPFRMAKAPGRPSLEAFQTPRQNYPSSGDPQGELTNSVPGGGCHPLACAMPLRDCVTGVPVMEFQLYAIPHRHTAWRRGPRPVRRGRLQQPRDRPSERPVHGPQLPAGRLHGLAGQGPRG